MKIKTFILITLLVNCYLLCTWSCTQIDDFDVPAIDEAQGIGEKTISMSEFLNRYAASAREEPTYIEDDEAVFYAYVVSDATQGNNPYTVFVQENTNGGPGLKIPVDRFNYSGDYPLGRKVLIHANGLYLGELSNVLVLGSGQGSFWSIPESRISYRIIDTGIQLRDSVRTAPEVLSSLKPEEILKPKKVRIADIVSGQADALIGSLIRLDEVSIREAGLPWVEYDNKEGRLVSTNRTVLGAANDSISIRTEAFANYATEIIPQGQGNIVGILDKFRDEYQIRLRDLRDLNFQPLIRSTRVQFNEAEAEVVEGSGKFTLSVQIEHASENQSTRVDVQLNKGDASLLGGFVTRTLIFGAGQSHNKTVEINLPIDVTGNKVFEFSLVNLEGGEKAELGDHRMFTLTVLDMAAPERGTLIFSEYLEGSGNNKYLEIRNVSGNQIDLSKFTLERYSNGSATPSSATILSDVDQVPPMLKAEEVLLLKNPNAVLVLPDGVMAIGLSLLNFNGDDALVLKNNEEVIDVIGLVGEDPGTAWAVAGISGATADHGLRRKKNIVQGNRDWNSSAGNNAANSEWEVVEVQDEASDLGL